MDLYIMRHGLAVGSFEWPGDDASRPLTEPGVARTREVIRRLAGEGRLNVGEIWSSPLVRAAQTAAIAGEVLSIRPRSVSLLACGCPPAELDKLLQPLAGALRGVLLVGHEPDCGLLIARLAGVPGGACPLKKAGVAYLSGSPRAGGMQLRWRLSPKEILGERKS